MTTITELLETLSTLSLDDHTRIIAPYATRQDNTIVYRARYGTYQINYCADTAIVTAYNDNNKRTVDPIIVIIDRYRNRLIAFFELPTDDNKPRERPFLRVEIVHHYYTKHFDAQSPVFVITEHEKPEL